MQNMIIRFLESGEISFESFSDVHEFWALNPVIKNRHGSATEITAWPQEHFQKPPPLNTVPSVNG